VKKAVIFLIVLAAAAGVWLATARAPESGWTSQQKEVLRSLWIGSMPDVPLSPSNAVADDPRAAELGYQLFFDSRLSSNGEISCAFCHQPERFFTDSLPIARGVQLAARHTMTVVGAAYSPWQFWDGRKDSLWSQALGPLEDPLEHGGSRLQIARLMATEPKYRDEYERLFGTVPVVPDTDELTTVQQQDVDQIFSNVGKSIAAYERLLVHGESRFDRYVQAVLEKDEQRQRETMSSDEVAGLRLFIADAQCINCHNGPLFTNFEFHNNGVLPEQGKVPALGRVSAVRVARDDPFNCLGDFSDDPQKACAELRYTKTGDDLIGAQKTPSLRNVADTAPYMHSGQMHTLADILDLYNRAPLALVGHNEAKPLNLSGRELKQLEAFLHTLSGPVAADPRWLTRPE